MTDSRKKKNMGADDPLKILKVIDRLDVGPPSVEKKRFIIPYTVTRGDSKATFHLVYSYNEPVFLPGSPESQNLATVIGVQVALNYGLFCEDIHFSGHFDEADTRFLSQMMDNTSREIFIKKFCEPNPFLTGEAGRLEPIKKSVYTQARLSFSSSENQIVKGKSPDKPDPDRRKIAVLSSGGKDSLLSFGLLKEMGREVHPLFINESGRHWFTALNAFREFQTTFPETAKSWTNADRLFAWMLRHLPFVRQDFARIRADEYPVRLWTVAVFLFGALPLIRKRGIGRVVIGDEFDTTAKSQHAGITHYNGLYDQSRYFDNALTRYYFRKGWDIQQFSLLRPLSELLIEKILVQRYPNLQKDQVSCHATHMEENRVKPCGRCEKCRRIIGMLMALDADPRECGYTSDQITHCLRELASKGVHQESAGALHLAYLLKSKELLPAQKNSSSSPPHPEIMKLRFDAEHSPMDAIPKDLRTPLYSIFLEHSHRAVRRLGRTWQDFDPLKSTEIDSPYPFDSMSGLKSVRLPIQLGELTWPEAQMRVKEMDVALLPVGSIEQHGPHLPLDTDAFDAAYLAAAAAKICTDPKPIVLPLVPYGVSYHHEDFSGTLSLSPDTLSALVYEIGMGAARIGITKLIIVNGHGGNIPALQFAAQKINRDSRIFTCVETGETSEKDVQELAETPGDVHAGEIETSTSLAVRPELVQMDKVKKFIPKFSSRYLDFSSKRSVEWYARVSRISKSGTLGDPTKATVEKGEKMWEAMIKHLSEFIEDLKSMSLDEILQRRF